MLIEVDMRKQEGLVLLQDPRQNPRDLLACLAKNWNLPAKPQDLSFPQHGISPTAVTLIDPHYVAKSLCKGMSEERTAWGIDVFRREHTVLQALTDGLADSEATPALQLGVQFPNLVSPHHPHNDAAFVMTRVAGTPLKENLALITDDESPNEK